MVALARVVVKGLRRVAIVGDRFETQPIFRQFKDELPAVAAELEVMDLTGLPMAELRKRVAALHVPSGDPYPPYLFAAAQVLATRP